MTNRTIGLLFLCSAAYAQDPAPQGSTQASPQDSVPAQGLEIRTDLHGEYLLGETMLVRIEVVNAQSSETLRFPDLSASPWLVRFRITDQEGKTQTRYNVAPEDEGEARIWEIPPRSRREVVLEIPSSSTFKAGQHTLQVEIKNGENTQTLPEHAFRLAAAKPVGGQVGYDALLSPVEDTRWSGPMMQRRVWISTSTMPQERRHRGRWATTTS